MTDLGIFPFGQPVRVVAQTDRSAKDVFVLGVYASAVHARWIGRDGKTLVKALAVASEPYIFWRGDNSEPILGRIDLPESAGKLVPASPEFNGPSGNVLDEMILRPLRLYNRDRVWLCDLIPHSCVNAAQAKAIERAYIPIAQEHGLPEPSVPKVPFQLADHERRDEIAAELEESGASILILLGDQPIQWFLKRFDQRWSRLSDFQRYGTPYGTLQETEINGRPIQVLPLAHPRQIGRLGQASPKWHELHREWQETRAGSIKA